MKSVCFIADRNIYLKRICNFIVQEGYDVQLICRNNKGLEISEFDDKIKIYQLQSKRLIFKIIEIYKILRKNKPDYVHFQYLVKDIIVALFLSNKVKVIVTPWGSDLNVFSKSIINRLIINIGLLSCDTVQFISEDLQLKFTQIFRCINRKKFVLLSWGIDYKRFNTCTANDILFWKNKLDISPTEKVILSYRNHAPIYNHHTLIKSLPFVVEKYPDIKCIFTRGSYDKDYLEQSKTWVSKLNLQNHVIFIEEWIKDEMMPSLIHMADIVVSIPFSDGLPATLLEIMSTSSIPVITKNEGFDVFFENGKNGFVLNNPKAEKDLAEIITFVFSNYNTVANTIIFTNNNYIAQYQNWAIQSKKLLDLYP